MSHDPITITTSDGDITFEAQAGGDVRVTIRSGPEDGQGRATTYVHGGELLAAVQITARRAVQR